MLTDDVRHPPEASERAEAGDAQRVPRSAELEIARRAQVEAEHRAAQAEEELRVIQAGLGWRALVSYRQILRRVAPVGSKRSGAYDLAVGTARKSSRLVRRGVVGEVNRREPLAPEVAADMSATPQEGRHTGTVAGPPGDDTWFREHYDTAAARVIEFLAIDGISLEDKRVADIGAGDGILDLGLVHKARPARLVGFDLNRVHADILLESARAHGVCESLPGALEFEVCGPTSIPAEDGSFDVVVSWSAFEHIDDPLGVLREIRRVVKDNGALFIQLWPFYHSQFGSHLRDWFPEGWEHLEMLPQEIEDTVRSSQLHRPEWGDVMLHEFAGLNRATVDDLGCALTEARFGVRRLNLLSRSVPLPPELASRLPLSVLGIEGVELTAVPLPR